MQQLLESKLRVALHPQWLEVLNESGNHSVPPGSETHFKVVVVSENFEGLALVQRHQRVYQVLAEELQSGVHALALHTYTPKEWKQKGGALASPACRGGTGK